MISEKVRVLIASWEFYNFLGNLADYGKQFYTQNDEDDNGSESDGYSNIVCSRLNSNMPMPQYREDRSVPSSDTGGTMLEPPPQGVHYSIDPKLVLSRFKLRNDKIQELNKQIIKERLTGKPFLNS